MKLSGKAKAMPDRSAKADKASVKPAKMGKMKIEAKPKRKWK